MLAKVSHAPAHALGSAFLTTAFKALNQRKMKHKNKAREETLRCICRLGSEVLPPQSKSRYAFNETGNTFSLLSFPSFLPPSPLFAATLLSQVIRGGGKELHIEKEW